MAHKEKPHVSRRELMIAGVSFGIGASLTAGGFLLWQNRQGSQPKRLSLDWEQLPPFKDDTLQGASFHGDAMAIGPPDSWPRVGIVGTLRSAFEERLADGGIAAAAYTDPGNNWHVGLVPPGKEFGVYGDHSETNAAAFHLGRSAVSFTFGVVEGKKLIPVETTRITEMTVAAMAQDPRMQNVAIS